MHYHGIWASFCSGCHVEIGSCRRTTRHLQRDGIRLHLNCHACSVNKTGTLQDFKSLQRFPTLSPLAPSDPSPIEVSTAYRGTGYSRTHNVDDPQTQSRILSIADIGENTPESHDVVHDFAVLKLDIQLSQKDNIVGVLCCRVDTRNMMSPLGYLRAWFRLASTVGDC